MPKDAGSKKLGEILLDHGAVNDKQLTEALKEQKSQGGLIGEVLIRLGFVKEEDIVVALATQFNFPYLPIDNFEINSQAVKTVPSEIVCQYLCIPIDRIETILTVVMSDPSNTNAIQEIEKVSGCRVQPFVGTVTQIKKAIKRYYQVSLAGDSPSSNVSQISFRAARERKDQGKTTT